MTESEKFYDDVIAPALLDLAGKCGERGMSFLSVVEYDPGNKAVTQRYAQDPSLMMILIRHAIKTMPNLDSFVIGVLKYAKDNDIDVSGSLIAQQLKRAPTEGPPEADFS